MKLNKKGNHVGVILSFVIFIMFVTFLYIFVSPSLESQVSKSAKINSLQAQIIENVTQTMTVRGVKIQSDNKNPNNENCFNLVNFFSNFLIGERRVIIQTVYTPQLNPYKLPTPNDLALSTGKSNVKLTSSNAFVKIYNSSGFPEIVLTPAPESLCDDLTFGTEYYVGYTREEKLVMASAIEDLIEFYESEGGYEQLKEKFQIKRDFGFNFTYEDGTTNIGTTKYVPQSSEVYSQEYPIVYAANNKGLEVGILSVRIW